jgi:hypothetical protein
MKAVRLRSLIACVAILALGLSLAACGGPIEEPAEAAPGLQWQGPQERCPPGQGTTEVEGEAEACVECALVCPDGFLYPVSGRCICPP